MIEWVWLHFNDNIVNNPVFAQCIVAVAASLFRWVGIETEFFPRIAHASRLEKHQLDQVQPTHKQTAFFLGDWFILEQPNVGKHQRGSPSWWPGAKSWLSSAGVVLRQECPSWSDPWQRWRRDEGLLEATPLETRSHWSWGFYPNSLK